MNNFLSSHIDPNKIFIINRSEIEGRLDSNQYHPERMRMIEKLKRTNTICVLKSVVDFSKNITSEIKDSDIYVGLENILSDTGEYIQTTDKQTISTAAIFRKGQILFPKLRPYLNKVFLANIDGICSTEFHVLSVRKGVLAEFLHIYLLSDIVVKQTKHLMTGNTLPRLQTDDIYNLPVPIIPIEEQQKIVELYQSAFQLKQQKEAQATALLASIDDYLLGELGITLPEQNTSLNDRIFITPSRKVTNRRFDPEYHSLKYKQSIQLICSSHYETYPLGCLTSVLSSGKTPARDEYTEIDATYPIIKVGSYTGDFIDISKAGYTIRPQLLKAQEGDIFILSAAHQAEYVGKHIKYLNEQPRCDTSYVGELICARSNDTCNSMFLFSMLNISIFKVLINREKTGQTSHVYGKDLRNILIPLPPLEKQNEIAEHIQSIRNQARNLQKEAQEILEKAKKEVEQIILGE